MEILSAALQSDVDSDKEDDAPESDQQRALHLSGTE
jgi:hypothetical protein